MKHVFLKKVIIFTALFVALSHMTACSPSDGGGTLKVSIPVDISHNNQYDLQDVELHTVTDINGMSGTTATFKADGRIDTEINSSGHEMIVNSNEGTVPSAHFLKVGGVLHPSDFLSLSMTTAMYHFENIKNFYDTFDANKNIDFPREVLVNVVLDRHSGGRDEETINNASYVGQLDMFWINPYKDANVPLTFNGGVLAHEYLHNIFMKLLNTSAFLHLKEQKISQSQFETINKLTKTPDVINEWYLGEKKLNQNNIDSDPGSGTDAPDVKLSDSETQDVNVFLFKSINEGIADYFGYEYSQNPSWITASLPSETFRVLDLKKNYATPVGFQKQRYLRAARPKARADVLDIHQIGAYFSHFLWTVSNEPTWGPLKTRVATLEFMGNYADFLSTDIKKKYLSMGDLVKMFFKKTPPGSSLCSKVQGMFPNELNSKDYPCDQLNIQNGGKL